MRAFTLGRRPFATMNGGLRAGDAPKGATIARRLINFSMGRPANNYWIVLTEKVTRMKSSKESHVAP